MPPPPLPKHPPTPSPAPPAPPLPPNYPAFVLPYEKAGEKALLVVNKKSVPLALRITGAKGGQATVVEVSADVLRCSEPGFEPMLQREVSAAGVLQLGPFGVVVVTELQLSEDERV